MTWLAVALLALGTASVRLFGMLAAGPLLARRPLLADAAALVPAAVVAALVAQLTFASGDSLSVDSRVVGMAVAAVLVWRRAPFVAVVVGAALATAIARGF